MRLRMGVVIAAKMAPVRLLLLRRLGKEEEGREGGREGGKEEEEEEEGERRKGGGLSFINWIVRDSGMTRARDF